MIGVACIPPKLPTLLTVNVPPVSSSRVIERSRARLATSPTASPSWAIESVSALRITGTISPCSVSTAMPRFTTPLTRISCFSSSMLELSSGCRRRALQIATRTMGMKLSLRPRTVVYSRRFRSSAVTSASSVTVKWTAVRTDRSSALAMVLRMPRMGMRSTTPSLSTVGAGNGEATARSATTVGAPSKSWTSAAVTRPPRPVPGTWLMSMPSSLATRRTAGVASALEPATAACSGSRRRVSVSETDRVVSTRPTTVPASASSATTAGSESVGAAPPSVR